MRATALLVTALLAIALILAFATAASAGPRQGTVSQPCDYSTDWKIAGLAADRQRQVRPGVFHSSPGLEAPVGPAPNVPGLLLSGRVIHHHSRFGLIGT